MKQIGNTSETKLRILVFGFIDMNTMDGSAVFLSSVATALALDKNIHVDLLLARPIKRDILLEPLEAADNITVINPYEDEVFKQSGEEWLRKGFLSYTDAESLICHYWSRNRYDWLLVRSMDTVERILPHSSIIEQTLVYVTGLTHADQNLNDSSHDSLKNIYEKCAYFLCQTKEMCQFVIDLLELPADHKVALLSPMIPDVEVEENQELTRQLVYTGKFDPDWRTIEIITAFKELKREMEDLTLHIAGDKFNRREQQPNFREEAMYLLRNTDGLNWYGALTRKDAQQLIVNSDIGITWRSPEMDSSLELSTKLLEYGILKKPVIMNPTKMHKQLFGEDYPLFANTEKEFRDAVKNALNDRQIYDSAAARMYQVSSNFVFSKALKRLQPMLWGKRIKQYMTDMARQGISIKADAESLPFLTAIPHFNIKEALLKNEPEGQTCFIIESPGNEMKKMEQFIRFSKSGVIQDIEKMGPLDFVKIKSVAADLETILIANKAFFPYIGTEVQRSPGRIKRRKADSKEQMGVGTNTRAIQRENKELSRLLQKLTRQQANLEHKYKALSSSKMGRLTMKYWEIRRRYQQP
ncbi:glycosyltransferase [Peribacillus sp. SCS-155]|uniref:glycosyltransferase n=1 Tax=Peribacillus sedimenti TaxID=3115297 RepID=UPI0039059CAF